MQGISGRQKPRCACCREKRLWALTLDHKHGGGSTERAVSHSTVTIVRKEYRATGSWPRHRFQVLCSTCNHGKRIAGETGHCPHYTERTFTMMKHKQDRIVAALSALAMAIGPVLSAFDVMTSAQSAALMSAVVAFLTGYNTDRGAAKDALK